MYKCKKETSTSLDECLLDSLDSNQTGDLHRFKSIEYTDIKDDEALVVCGKANDLDYLSFGATSKNSLPVFDNAVLGNGTFCLVAAKSMLVMAITRDKMGFNIRDENHPRYIPESMFQHNKNVYVDECNDVRFYFDMIGSGDIEEIYVKKYHFTELSNNQPINWFPRDRPSMICESNIEFREIVAGSLARDNKAIQSYFKTNIIGNQTDPMMQGYYIYEGYDSSKYRSDVLRFVSEPVSGEITVYWIDHKKTGCCLYSNLCLVKDCKEVLMLEPKELTNNVFTATIEVPDGEHKLVETLYGGPENKYRAADPRSVYPMIILKTLDIVKNQSLYKL